MAVDHAERHLLDEADVVAMLDSKLGQFQYFVMVAVFQNDGVELDFLDTGIACSIQAGEYAFEFAVARQRGEAFRFESVETDIDPLDACLAQLFCIARQLRAIGSQCQIIESFGFTEFLEHHHDVTAVERFTACNTNFVDAQTDGRLADTDDLFKSQQLFSRDEFYLFRHAVDAAQVTPVSNRHAQIVYLAPESVYESVSCISWCCAIHGISRDFACIGSTASD
ncbi:hypothetical protein JV46_29840 [Solemya velum gill symbiont]|uniref:Uncharacterized protein n=1 Tax=Solemya velum gill symbiont TaxID=2340 RepID=A0A0B0HAN4_SOVGS|nr:hypothetical protein JV46_29840 [Solemya velum gill symbiont]